MSITPPVAAVKISYITNKIIEKGNIATMMITPNIHAALTTGTRKIIPEGGSFFWVLRAKRAPA